MPSQSVLKIVVFICFFDAIVGSVVNTTETNEIIYQKSTPFEVYWNVPTFQCASHQIYFTDIVQKFGIIQNERDRFRGNEISIMYDPGYFPALLEDKNAKKYSRNGGVPQQGNLTLHLENFKRDIDKQIPDTNFHGIGVIDFESWRPIFRQNFGILVPYKEYSINLEHKMHPFWPNFMIEKEAKRRFEYYGKIFMEETLIYAKQLRPRAIWGYYAYPYCFNMNANTKIKDCSTETKEENDRISWLFDNSDAYYPSLYMSKNVLTSKEKIQMIEGRIKEAQRIVGQSNNLAKKPKILPYFGYRYRDEQQFLTKDDLFNSITTLKTMKIDGMVLWGSSKDVNTKEKCQKLKTYVESVLGPTIASKPF